MHIADCTWTAGFCLHGYGDQRIVFQILFGYYFGQQQEETAKVSAETGEMAPHPGTWLMTRLGKVAVMKIF